ncbi:MAG: hypothetical protein RSA93_03360 [Longicatena sp.]
MDNQKAMRLSELWLCIDRMDGTVLAGRIYSQIQEAPIIFNNFDMLIIKVDDIFDAIGHPQSFQISRSMVSDHEPSVQRNKAKPKQLVESNEIYKNKGQVNSFILSVETRQFSNWQGVLKDENAEVIGTFKDVIEFLHILYNAKKTGE